MQLQFLRERRLHVSAVFAVSLIVPVLHAQDSAPIATIQPGTPAVEQLDDFPLATPVEAVDGTAAPLDFKGKTDYFLKAISSPESMARIALTSGLSTGSGESYLETVRSRYATHLTRRSIQFAVGAARGEDPRFHRSGKEGFWARTGFVLSRTVLVDMDNGGTSIAAGKLAGNLAGNAISAYWQPDRPNPLSRSLTNTGLNLAGDAGMRMVREFWPDLKRLFIK